MEIVRSTDEAFSVPAGRLTRGNAIAVALVRTGVLVRVGNRAAG